MRAESIAAGKAGGYARYLEGKIVMVEPGGYYLSRDGEPVQEPGRWLAMPGTLAGFGIEGQRVEGREFIALMEGRHPRPLPRAPQAAVFGAPRMVVVLLASMSRVGSNELPGSMATLGTVIETPDMTVRDYKKSLNSRFRRARFAGSTANNTLPRLARDGLVRRTYKAPGTARYEDRYTVTAKGLKAFRDWMYDLDADGLMVGMPALRDGTYGRIEFCDPLQDLPYLIERARAEQQISTDLYEQATRRLRTHMRKTDPLDFRAKVRGVLLYVDPLHWSSRAERYAQIAQRLEEIQREVEQHLAEMAL